MIASTWFKGPSCSISTFKIQTIKCRSSSHHTMYQLINVDLKRSCHMAPNDWKKKNILSVKSHCWSICLIHWEIGCFWRCVLWRENDGGKCLNDRGAETDSWQRCLISISTGFNCYLLSFQILIQSYTIHSRNDLCEPWEFVGVEEMMISQELKFPLATHPSISPSATLWLLCSLVT